MFTLCLTQWKYFNLVYKAEKRNVVPYPTYICLFYPFSRKLYILKTKSYIFKFLYKLEFALYAIQFILNLPYALQKKSLEQILQVKLNLLPILSFFPSCLYVYQIYSQRFRYIISRCTYEYTIGFKNIEENVWKTTEQLPLGSEKTYSLNTSMVLL